MPIINAITNSENLGNNLFITLGILKNLFINIPNETGKKTTRNTDFINPIIFISISTSARFEIRRGVAIIDNKVDKNVLTTERATFPLHKYVITFDAVPPGHEPTIINPKAISGDNLNKYVNKNAVKGITRNCKITEI